MPRQITDREYMFLQGRRQVADFVESIYNDPQLNKEAKALIKRKYPQIQIPDYDLENRLNQRFDAEKQARDKVEQDKRDAEADQQLKQTRTKVQKEYGFTDDGMKELEDFMVKKNVGDYEVAATYHASKNPKQSDATHHDGFWNHQKQEGFAKISEDPEGWARGEIINAIRRDEQSAKNQRF